MSEKNRGGRPKGTTKPALVKRNESKNRETVNCMVNLFDIVLERMSARISDPQNLQNLDEWKEILKEFKTLSYMLDPMLRRWYLVHKGYDSNVKQAHVDTETKTEKERKKKQKNQPLEEQVTAIAHYDPAMQELIDTLTKNVESEKQIDGNGSAVVNSET